MSCPYKAAVEETVQWYIRPAAGTKGNQCKRTPPLGLSTGKQKQENQTC
jgi:hypothetical protein